MSSLKLHKVTIEDSPNSYYNWLSSKFDGSTFSVKRYVIGPGGKIARHTHLWEHAIFVIEGTGTIRDTVHEQHILSPGIFLYVPAGVYHSFSNPSLTKPLIFICVSPSKSDERIEDDSNR